MKIEVILSSYVREFWDFVQSAVSKPLKLLGGIDYVAFLVAVATAVLTAYKLFPSLRRVLWVLLASVWFVIVVSAVLMFFGGG